MAALTVAPIVALLRLASVSYAGVAAPLLLLDVVIVARSGHRARAARGLDRRRWRSPITSSRPSASASRTRTTGSPSSPSRDRDRRRRAGGARGAAAARGGGGPARDRAAYQQLDGAFERASEAEAARRNEQLKAALLDALTHNLRTPLTAIKASVTALIGSRAFGRRSRS